MSEYSLKRYGPKKHWYVFYSVGRRSKRASTGTTSHVEAKGWRDDFVRERLTPKDAPQDQISVASVLKRYFDDHRRPWAGEANAATNIKQYDAFYDGDMVSSINHESNIRFENERVAAGIARNTVNQQRATLRAALNHARKTGRLASVPYIGNAPPIAKKLRILSRDEAARLLRECRRARVKYLTLFVRIALYTGVRHRAILELTWDRVDFATGWIEFNVPGRELTKKRRPEAPMRPKMLRMMAAAVRKTNGKHVIGGKSDPMTGLWVAFRGACKRAGITGVTPHTLKHTMVSWGLQKASPWDMVGYTATSLTTITNIYGKHIRSHLKGVAAALDAK
jgi:integrase